MNRSPTPDSPHPAFARNTVVFLDGDDGGGTGFIEEFGGVRVRAKNIKEARKQLKDAAQTFIDENREDILRRMDSDGPVTREKMLLEIWRRPQSGVDFNREIEDAEKTHACSKVPVDSCVRDTRNCHALCCFMHHHSLGRECSS